MTAIDNARLRDTILELCKTRGLGKSICPSEVARQIAGDGDWRALMPEVRRVAADLAADDRITITQRGETVDLASVRGPVRLRLSDAAPD